MKKYKFYYLVDIYTNKYFVSFARSSIFSTDIHDAKLFNSFIDASNYLNKYICKIFYCRVGVFTAYV